MKNKKVKILAVALSLIVVLITGCDPSKKWARQEQDSILNYLGSIGDTVYEKKASGLYYHELVLGTGDSPVTNDTASIYYKGKFLDGSLLGTNMADTIPLKFIVGSSPLIEGIAEGVTYMKAGGKAKLLIPSSLAYGAYGYSNGYITIPGYTPLIFEISLVQVNKHAK